jgi:hypothetical protein
MKTGIELIAEERREQIEKHGFSLELDAEYYKNNELIEAAHFALQPNHPGTRWPDVWDITFAEKIKNKNRVGQLKVAGALIAAEIDRLQAMEETEVKQ